MQRIFFFIIAVFICSMAIGQGGKYYIRADSTVITKVAGSNELILENSTRSTTGVLVNYGNGRTRFSKPRIVGDTLFIGVDTILGVGAAGASWALTDTIRGVIVKAIPDDGLEDSVAFKAAVVEATARGLKNIYVMPGSYVLNAQITIDKQNLLALGGGGVTIRTTRTVGSPEVPYSVFKLIDSCTVDGFSFYGSGRDAAYIVTNIAQNAIMIGGNSNNVKNCRMRSMKGAGVYLYNSGLGVFYTNQITNVFIDSCTVGYFNNYYAEYTVFSNSSVRWCATALLEYGNNNSIVGVDFIFNDDAGYINNGVGDDHGFMTGCSFNHNGMLTLKNLQVGYVISSTQFFQTTFFTDDADRVILTGCAFQGMTIAVNGTSDSVTTSISNAYIYSSVVYNIAGTGILHKSGIITGGQLYTELASQDDANEGKFHVYPTKIVVPPGGGDVGIGTNTPAARLHIAGSSGSTLRVVDGNQGAGKVLVSDGDGDATWTSSGSIGIPISSITAATGTNTINNGNFLQQWNWNSLTDNGLILNSNSAAAAGSNQVLFELGLSGANSNSAQTTKAFRVLNSHTGTTSTNIGAQFEAVNGTNNYAIIVPASSGSVGIGTSTPTQLLEVAANIKYTGQLISTKQTVTYGTTTTWNWNAGTNAEVTLTGNITTFTITNAVAGTYATIRIIQDGAGSRLLSALPSGSKVFNGGAGVITLSTGANAIDLLTVYYDGTNYYWNYALNYN